MKYTLFIDESGESGITKIRTSSSPGATPYMTLGAALIATSAIADAEKRLEQIKADIKKKDLHCSKLSHYPLIHFARSVSQEKVRFFGVISRKETLGDYRDNISNDHSKFYNKCTQYLLERVGNFMEHHAIKADELDIVFEKAANIDYARMKNFIRACQNTPRHPETRKLKNIDINRIAASEKSEQPLLQLADLAAHALYKCVDAQPKNFGIAEPRYLFELSSRFAGHPKDGSVVGYGIYCIHSIKDLQLEDQHVVKALKGLTADVSGSGPL